MFRMLGKKVELYRYIVTYTENEEVMIENCISEKHKNEIEQMLTDRGIEFTSKTVNQSQNEWFNGLEFNSYDEALEALNSGQAAYEHKIAQKESSSNLKLRADIDSVLQSQIADQTANELALAELLALKSEIANMKSDVSSISKSVAKEPVTLNPIQK